MGQTSGGSLRSGVIFGLIAYVSWGIVPLYFHWVKQVGPLDILAHRIVWSLAVLAVVTTVARLWPDLVRVLRDRKLVRPLACGAVLLALNWLLFIYAASTGRVTEAGLGYYMMPLVNAGLATVFLGERLRPAHYPALALVGVGVIIPFAWTGTFTWIAVALPVTFGIYSLVRKQVPVSGLTGLTVETLVLLVPSLGYLAYQAATGRGHFGPGDLSMSGLLMLGGVVTVLPLVTFAVSLRRMPLVANSFIQFVSPTIQLMVALWVIGEVVPPERWAAIMIVWAAVAIFLADAAWKASRPKVKVIDTVAEPSVAVVPEPAAPSRPCLGTPRAVRV